MGFFQDSWSTPVRGAGTLPRCGACGLSKRCKSPRMPPTGKGVKSVLVVAEAPGRDEDEQGVQLVGDAGRLLRRLMKEIGEDLEDCTKTNAVICRPPNNQIDDRFIESCRPNLMRTIAEVKPRVIILLGGSAVQSLIAPEWNKDLGPLSRWVGWAIPSQTHKAWICPTYHPSFINRMNEDSLLCLLTKEHLKRAFELESVEVPLCSVRSLQKQVQILSSSDAAEMLGGLNEKEGRLAFDFETTGLKPDRKEQRIFSCSTCFEGEETFSFLVDARCDSWLSSVLKNRKLKKIASNIKFEERWSREKFGHGVSGWWWDTMLAAHCLDNRAGITSIKFQAYIHLGVGDYSSSIESYLKSSEGSNGLNRIDEAPREDLLKYNGLDSLLEYKVAEIQRRMFSCQ